MTRLPSNLLYILAILCAFCGAGSSDTSALTLPSVALIVLATGLGLAGARAEAQEGARALGVRA